MKQVTIAIPGCPVQRFQICVGNQPDDIAQWIAERIKRFPRTQQQQQQIPPPPTPPTTVLGNLLDGYGSSSDSDSNSNTKAIQTQTQSTPTKKTMDDNYRKPRPCRYFQRNGTCRNGDQCHFSHDPQQQQQQCRQINTFKTNTKIKVKTKSSSTLLRKLLTTDQDRETTLTLALLRYLVDCNYLQHQREST